MSTEAKSSAVVPDTEGFITKKEVARRLNKTVRTIEHWQRKGALPYMKVGQSVLFKWSDVEMHLQTNFRVCRPRLEKMPVKL
jgi:excisionase family DNA binding protein